MLPFTISITAGRPVTEQVVAAVHRAMATEQLKPGDEFPSLRKLSTELGINPNTAQKIVSTLTAEGVLEVHPGMGTRVVDRKTCTQNDRARELRPDIAAIVIHAKRLGGTPDELAGMIREEWSKLDQ